LTERRLRAATAVLAVVGIGVAVYLTYARYADVALVCTAGGCEKVQSSSYSELVGIPVPLLGAIGYVVILATALVPGETARAAGAGLALGGLAVSLYLLAIQLVVFDAVCLWCVVNDGVILLLTIAGVTRIAIAGRAPVAA
jgi:uncharacterized membrane protein